MTAQQTIEVLNSRRASFEEAHGVKIQDDAIDGCVRHASQVGILPGAALALLDRSCASLRVQTAPWSTELAEIDEEIVRLSQCLLDLVAAQDFEETRNVRQAKDQLSERRNKLLAAWRSTRSNNGSVSASIVDRIAEASRSDDANPDQVV